MSSLLLASPSSGEPASGEPASGEPAREGADPYATVPEENPLRPEGAPLDEPREAPQSGREEEAGIDPVLAAARVLFFPAHLVLEYGLRRPLGFATSSTEGLLHALLTSEEEGQARLTVWPVLRVRTDRDAVVGAYVGADDPVVRGLRVEAGAASDFHENVESYGRVVWSPAPWLAAGVHGAWDSRDDVPFHGIGAGSGARYSAFAHRVGRGGAALRLGPLPTGLSGRAGVDYADHELGCSPDEAPDACTDDEGFRPFDPLGDREVPGFADYALLAPSLSVGFDSRDDAYASGVVAGLQGRWGVVLDGDRASDDDVAAELADFTAYRAEGRIDWQLFRHRVLALGLRYEAVNPLDEGAVPLPELPSLGGGAWMSGFHEGRLRGHSAVAAQIDYSYPVWSFLRGNLFVGLGEAFGPGSERFESGRLHASAGLGLETGEVVGLPFRSVVALGTEALGDGLAIETGRFTLELGWEPNLPLGR